MPRLIYITLRLDRSHWHSSPAVYVRTVLLHSPVAHSWLIHMHMRMTVSRAASAGVSWPTRVAAVPLRAAHLGRVIHRPATALGINTSAGAGPARYPAFAIAPSPAAPTSNARCPPSAVAPYAWLRGCASPGPAHTHTHIDHIHISTATCTACAAGMHDRLN